MSNITLVDRLGNFTGPTIVRSRLDNGSDNLKDIIKSSARPHAHVIIFSKGGLILVQKRHERKRFMGGKEFLIHGGHITEEDKFEAEKRGKNLQSAYRIGAVRELKGELRINVKEWELRRLMSKYFYAGETTDELRYNVFIRFFDMIYQRDLHGAKVINRSEVEDEEFMDIKEIIESGLLSIFGNKAGPYLKHHIEQASFKIKYLGYQYVLDEMKGRKRFREVPQDAIDIANITFDRDAVLKMMTPSTLSYKLQKN